MDLSNDLREALPQPQQRLLRWCDTGTTRPLGHRPLLQVESGGLEVSRGEVVNVLLWITDQDLKAGRFDGVRHGFEVA
ncbi:hypothetical protein [Kitasatospora sp. NPDC094015]|uniref:hypothetical protein n=1 Tax=Kitasatospora sp. NPDC094015 TaxID=3155205 RepID=UPI00331C4EF3